LTGPNLSNYKSISKTPADTTISSIKTSVWMPTFTLIGQHTISAHPIELLYIMILRFNLHKTKRYKLPTKSTGRSLSQ
jgi:hypothetical protein